MKEQTIEEYAKISQIPLKEVLNDLKGFGFTCNSGDVLNKEMRQKLSNVFQQRRRANEEEELGITRELAAIRKMGDATRRKVMELEALRKAREEKALGKAREDWREETLRKVREAEELRKAKEEEALEKAREEKALIKSTESEALLYAEYKASEVLSKSSDALQKIGKIIDLCVDLVPEKVKDSVSKEINSKSFYEFIPEFYCRHLKKLFFAQKRSEIYEAHNKDEKYAGIINKNHGLELLNEAFEAQRQFSAEAIVPYWVICEYNANDFERTAKEIYNKKIKNKPFYNDLYGIILSELKKSIDKRKKEKNYTSALISISYYFLSRNFFNPDSAIITSSFRPYDRIIRFDFRELCFIGELLMDMAATDSYFKLYSIDSRLFYEPNLLGLLVDGAIKADDVEQSRKLLEKLIEQEPYHPSISTLKADVKRLEQRHRLKANFSIDFSKINELSGLDFENLLLDKFSEMSFKVESTPKTGDFGADLIIENIDGTRIAVQCKRFKSKVNLKAVQEVIGAMGHYCCDMGIVITNSSFLNSAIKLAESHDIELWDGDKLVSFLAGDLSFSKVVGD
jgi:HJR/Mrr/RecB family endonuclease